MTFSAKTTSQQETLHRLCLQSRLQMDHRSIKTNIKRFLTPQSSTTLSAKTSQQETLQMQMGHRGWVIRWVKTNVKRFFTPRLIMALSAKTTTEQTSLQMSCTALGKKFKQLLTRSTPLRLHRHRKTLRNMRF